MTTGELEEEISIELDLIESTVQELLSLRRDLADREPSVREKTCCLYGSVLQWYGKHPDTNYSFQISASTKG